MCSVSPLAIELYHKIYWRFCKINLIVKKSVSPLVNVESRMRLNKVDILQDF